VIINTQDYAKQTVFPLPIGIPIKQAIAMKVMDLTLIDCSVDAYFTVREVAKLFEMHQEWPGVILKSGMLYMGMLSRNRCFEVLGKPYGLEVYSRKTILEFYDAMNHKCIVIDGESSIQDAVVTALTREKSQIFEPVVVQLENDLFRLVNIHDLLLAQCDVLENLYEEVHQLSIIDPLTQLNNRRGFFECAQPEVIHSHNTENDLSALMIDIDNFKKTNDVHGHFVGDHVLCAVAEEIQKTLRQTDLIGRYGGEEFVGLLPSTSIEAAQIIAERLLKAIENRMIKVNETEVSVTVSIGICHIADANGSLDMLLTQADQAMYYAKATGKNRVSQWTPDISNSAALDVIKHGLKIKSIQKNNTKKSDQISKIYDETIDGWSKAIEMRDKEMEGHSKRVVELTLELARKCGVQEKDLDDIRRGALLHDIGKIAIPDPILFKPGKLNEEEWQIMRKHPVYAFEFLAPITFLKKSIDIPYCHHEHWDGTGYPRGLKGEEIPLAARIFTIIDVWDALCSDRCYRSAWPLNEVQDYIVSQSGKLFDPRLTDIFIQLIEEKLIIEPNNDAQILEFS
jgi:diguanylate cyclase (GGDEF)-like protein/putative nucleotidyltransferase with HDIG domain